jgi:small-conductance mechanosensitive channel
VRATRDALTATAVALTVIAAVQPVELGRAEGFVFSTSASVLVIFWLGLVHAVGAPIVDRVVTYRYDSDIAPIVRNVWTLSVLVLAVFALFEAWDVDVTPLLASAGVAGIVLGLAARETISNFFGSIALYADDTYEVGEYIEVEGMGGFVEDISIRSTRLRTLDDNFITVPNSKLHDSMVKNKGAPTSSHRIEIEVSVSYNDDHEAARGLIEDTVEKAIEDHAELLDSERSEGFEVLLKELADSAIVFRIFVWIEDPSDEPELRDGISSEVYAALEKEGVKIPYPQRSVHIDDGDNDSDNDKDNDGVGVGGKEKEDERDGSE